MSATLAACVLSIFALTVSVLVMQTPRRPYHIPLISVLCALAVLVSPPLANLHSLSAYYAVQVFGIVSLVALSPCFWLYVCALTETQPWHLRRRQLPHLLPVLPTIGLAVAWLILPANARHSMLIKGELTDGLFAMAVAALTWLTILFWIAQSACYLILSMLRLRRYRQRLLDHFADPEPRRLRWLSLAMVLLITIWVWFLLAGFVSNVANKDLMDRTTANALLLVTVWLLSLWGIVQQPGFSGYQAPADDPPTVSQADPENSKYQRSALGSQQSARIAERLTEHMQQTHMYLQSDLTLTQLAEAIHAVPHYVSQTLNDTMGTTFFDYISLLRVEQAKTLLKTTDNSVTDIAYQVGFNARSSFYKAFRQITGATPTQFRKLDQ